MTCRQPGRLPTGIELPLWAGPTLGVVVGVVGWPAAPTVNVLGEPTTDQEPLASTQTP